MKILLAAFMIWALPVAMPERAASAEEEQVDLGPTHEGLLRHWRENPRTPADYVLEKFQSHKWVFLGEYHRIKHDADLVNALIPRLHAESGVRHLAFEFLCREQTERANELISAETYDRGRAIEFFRSQFPAWPYEEYLEIFRTSWESNRRLAKERGAFRLIGLHPCPDYEVIHFGTDEAAADRERAKQKHYDEIMAATLEEQVLEPGVEALIFSGVAHATAKFNEYWFGTDRPLPRMGNLVYRTPYKDEMFFISLHATFWDAGTESDIYPFDGILDRLMLDYGRDIGFDVTGTPFESLEHSNKSTYAITQYRFGDLYDGYIIHRTPLRESLGVTCVSDWIASEDAFRHYWRHLGNKKAALSHAQTPFAEFKRDFCAPSPDHGVEFKRRFRNLPEL